MRAARLVARRVLLVPGGARRVAGPEARGEAARRAGCVAAAAAAKHTMAPVKGEFFDEGAFERLAAEMRAYDEERDTVIKRSRDILKAAKTAVYCLHRGEADKAAAQLAAGEAVARELLPTVQREPTLRGGSYSAAMEEYAEAHVFKRFLETGALPPPSELPLADRDEYLGGVLDFSGELNRYAVARATARDVDEVRRCRDLVDALMGQFLKFDFRNGALRKKYDGLKYTLRKLENTLYELSLTGSAAKRAREEGGADLDDMQDGGDENA